SDLEDAALAAEADDVPHDQEIAGEVEPLDHAELVLELPADARRDRPIALACAALGERAQAAARRLAGRERELRKTVAQVRERERAALGDAAALADGVGHVPEQRRHLRGRLQMALDVGEQPPPRLVEGRAEADAGEDVEDPA